MPKGFRQYENVERQHRGGSDSVDTSDPGVNGMTSGRTFNERMKDAPAANEPHMPNPAAGAPGGQWFWDTQPGIGPDWLPEGLFPEIDELRKEHLQCFANLSEVGEKRSETVAGFAAEDQARDAALYAGEEAPTVTGTADREDAMRDVEAEVYAARRKLHDFYLHAVATFQRMATTWQLEFARVKAQRAAEVEAAKAALAAAEREAANVEQAEQWVKRTVNPRGGRYIQAPTFGVGFMTEAEKEDRRRDKRSFDGAGEIELVEA